MGRAAIHGCIESASFPRDRPVCIVDKRKDVRKSSQCLAQRYMQKQSLSQDEQVFQALQTEVFTINNLWSDCFFYLRLVHSRTKVPSSKDLCTTVSKMRTGHQPLSCGKTSCSERRSVALLIFPKTCLPSMWCRRDRAKPNWYAWTLFLKSQTSGSGGGGNS